MDADDASAAENAECQSAQPWSVQEGAPLAEATKFTILGTVSIDDIELTLVKDLANDEVHLALDHLNPKGNKPHKILEGLGFTQDHLMIPFHELALKIEAHTNGTIHPSR